MSATSGHGTPRSRHIVLKTTTTDHQRAPEVAGIDADRWDEFVASTAGGEHIQTSMWARLKANEGWDAVRVVAEHGTAIVGGFQMLLRRVPVVGAIGYIPKGPLFADDEVAAALVGEIDRLARRWKIRHLTVQAANGGWIVEDLLAAGGFQRSSVPVAPNATLILDLSKSEDELLAEMTARTRYNVRLGHRRGLSCRMGDRADLPGYHRMLLATSRRQQFETHGRSYLEAMWDALSANGHISLLLVERQGQAVAGMLAIGFAGTFTNKLSVWSGEHGSDRPNETLQWCAIRWAKSHGFERYDFEGIEIGAARALAAGGELPEESKDSVTSFKVGFGGSVVITPDPWYRVDNPVAGWVYRRYTAGGAGARLAKRMSDRLRTGR